jgi:cytidine deaminase
MPEIEITLPPIHRDPVSIETGAGRLIVPGRGIEARRLMVDPELLARSRDAARDAAERAHAPYSQFRVGAAVVMADDHEARLFTGCNVENATSGATICAERNAITTAVGAGFRKIRYVVVSCRDALDETLGMRGPCGICRQTIAEFASDTPPTLVLIDTANADDLGEILDLDRLLPYPFQLS